MEHTTVGEPTLSLVTIGRIEMIVRVQEMINTTITGVMEEETARNKIIKEKTENNKFNTNSKGIWMRKDFQFNLTISISIFNLQAIVW